MWKQWKWACTIKYSILIDNWRISNIVHYSTIILVILPCFYKGGCVYMLVIEALSCPTWPRLCDREQVCRDQVIWTAPSCYRRGARVLSLSSLSVCAVKRLGHTSPPWRGFHSAPQPPPILLLSRIIRIRHLGVIELQKKRGNLQTSRTQRFKTLNQQIKGGT